MSSPQEYRDLARECMLLVEQTESESQRLFLIDMAKQFSQAALAAERTNAPPNG